MDASNRSAKVDFVLGRTPRIEKNDLHFEDWWQIFEEALAKVKPVMKYLPGFDPIEKSILAGHLGGPAYRSTPFEPTYPEGVTGKTKAFVVEALDEAETDTMKVRRQFVFTEDGQFLLHSAEYDRPAVGSHGDQHEVARTSKFELLTREKLDDMDTFPHQWKRYKPSRLLIETLRHLFVNVRSGVCKRRQQLESVESADKYLVQILDRISLS